MKHSFWEQIKKWLQLSDKAGNKQKYLLVLLLLGIALMFISKMIDSPAKNVSMSTLSTKKQSNESEAVFKDTKGVTSKNIRSYEDRYANQLKDLLEQIQGVESATVFVELDTTERKEIARDDSVQRQTTSENDKSGGKRTIEDQKTEEKVVIVQNDGREEPIVITTEKPKIRGIAVVAQGAENLQTKAMIIDVITKVFDIGSHNVSVVPKKYEGD
ncbi:stage III sporulation protein AG [Fictibacillus phosphorivorans]|uniref:stage III sporulation protein AG n=1 Tax=Fictibacillus phosphorivorans TaxID=1221500 RepID=UPI00203CA24D|nr:stage III sporulation protein AG [Fictibacillus phosphorivorans]MCM3716758.1 stage III sporulation protein AG [Fictibacillus phosphorivorans]MCM3774693.1 stage III sporulation protein AG [Fictibacillus phosphorivorans]